jgi:hypothetical protein
MQTVEEATKALWDYINGLPDDKKQAAIVYQRQLEQEALRHPGGMNGAIKDELQYQSERLASAMTEVSEIAASHIADHYINKAKQ